MRCRGFRDSPHPRLRRLCWSIFTYCKEEPYADIPRHTLASWLEDGNRLKLPPTTPKAMQQIVQLCWSWAPRARPNFAQLRAQLCKASSTPGLATRLNWEQLR